MEIVKTKGLPDKYLRKDQETKLIDLVRKLKELPVCGEFKRVFYRACPIYGKRLIPYPSKSPRLTPSFMPKVFVGDILLNSKNIVESVLIKFVLENGRVIPVDEWFQTVKEIFQRLDQLYENYLFPGQEGRENWEEQYNAIMLELKLKNVAKTYLDAFSETTKFHFLRK